MAERAEVQDHWTRKGVLARIDDVLKELGHDPQVLTPEILATVEHLHSGGLATTRDQAERLTLTANSRVLDIGCGIGGPARYLANTYGCRVDGIDLTPELVETGLVLTERCGLADRVTLQLGDALDPPFADETFSSNGRSSWPTNHRPNWVCLWCSAKTCRSARRIRSAI